MESLWRKIPKSPWALRSELHLGVVVVGHELAEAEVQQLDCAFAEHDVAGLEVEVDDLFLEAEEVVEHREELPDDRLGLGLFDAAVLPHIDGQLDPVAVLQLEDDLVRALYQVVELDDVAML